MATSRRLDGCLEDTEVEAFVYDPEFKQRMLKHVVACAICRPRALLWQRACNEARQDFNAYAKGALGDAAEERVQKHLSACGHCIKEYAVVAERYAEAELAAASRVRRSPPFIEVVVGLIRDLSRLRVAPALSVLHADTRGREAPRGPRMLRRGGVEAELSENADGRLVARIRSDQYTVAKVGVVLGHGGKRDFQEVARAVTTAAGIARFGPVDQIPAPGRDGYTVKITGVISRSKPTVQRNTEE